MSDIVVLEAISSFIKEEVASKIKLQKANDDNILAYELVPPEVHIGWIPPNGLIPKEITVIIPGIIVGFDDADDDGQDAGMNVRLSFAVFSPGSHKLKEDGSTDFTPDFQGYRDLMNLIEKTKQSLIRNRIIGGITTVEPPFKRGMYQEQPYPYWYGWLTFRARMNSNQYVESIRQQYL